MNNKKGFTFVELLVVIALIGVIFVIAFPTVYTINKRVNERLYKTKIELILSAAEMYAQDEKVEDEVTVVTVEDLLENKYLVKDKKDNSSCESIHGCIFNPLTNEPFNDLEILVTKSSNNSYIATIKE